MLNFLEITKSRLRQKVLVYFFTNPETNVYVRELAFFLKEDPGNLSKELSKLEKEKVLTALARGNQKNIFLNKKYPLYHELKAIIFKTIGVEGSLKKIIGEEKGIALAFIYGSFAQAKETASSDIDLCIVGHPEEDKLLEKIERLEKILNREINYNIYPEKEFQAKLKKKDSFFQNILKRPKIFLKGSLHAA